MKKVKKGVVLAGAAAALLAAGFVATPAISKQPTMVKCTKKGGGCGLMCGHTTSQVMTLDECRKWGGTPSPVNGD
jgi:hypothetical protein